MFSIIIEIVLENLYFLFSNMNCLCVWATLFFIESSMRQQPVLSAPGEEHIQKVLHLARRLEEDPVPCSYWGLDEDRFDRLFRASNRQGRSTIVFIISAFEQG